MTSTSNQFCTNMKDETLIVSESSQANVKMTRKFIGIHFVQKDLGVWEIVHRKNFFKSLFPERQKMPLCGVGQFVYMTNLHFWKKNMISPIYDTPI